MRGSVRLGRIAGIEVGVHYTWLLAFALIAWTLAVGLFPAIVHGRTMALYWIMGILASLLLFVSVLLHEFAHSLVAQARGLPVHSITLFIFGGVSNLEEEAEKPGVEFVMALVGPLTSLVLAGILWGVGLLIGLHGSPLSIFTGNYPSLSSPVAALIYYLSSINLTLGAFNLLPGFPLDGGRVLRSIVWGATGNLARATNVAAISGRIFGWGFITYGVFQLFTGNLIGGLWIAFIGWFLSNAADASRREVTLREHLSGVPIRQVMDPDLETIDPGTSVQDMVWRIFMQRRRRAVPVAQNNQIVGIVTITDVRELPQAKWAETPVEKVMTRQPLYSVAPEDDLNSAMKLMARYDLNQVLVLRQGQLVGIISRADIIRYLQFSEALGMKSKQNES